MLSKQEFDRIAASRGGLHISMFLRTHRGGRDTREDPIRLKNQMSEAVSSGAEAGFTEAAVRRALAPAEELAGDIEFWRHLDDGLAVFASEHEFQAIRVPHALEDFTYVGERFTVRPVLPAVSDGRMFYVLAIAQKSVRLLECSPTGAREIELKDVPQSVAEALGPDWEQPSLQFHTGTPATVAAGRGSTGGAERRPAVFHGQGRGVDERKAEVEQFFHRVDDGVCRILRERRAPLVVAAVEHELAIYKRVSKYPDLVDQGVEGNTEHMGADEVFALALPAALPRLDQERSAEVGRVSVGARAGAAIVGIEWVLPAVREGRIGTLAARCENPVWGRADAGGVVERHGSRRAGDDDVLDLTIAEAIAAGAKVYPVLNEEFPSEVVVAGLTRF